MNAWLKSLVLRLAPRRAAAPEPMPTPPLRRNPDWPPSPERARELLDRGESVPRDWLDRQVTIDEAEAMYTTPPDQRSPKSPEDVLPFGRINWQWEALKSVMQPGDELWTYASPVESWRALAGVSGLVVVRAGAPVAAMITIRN